MPVSLPSNLAAAAHAVAVAAGYDLVVLFGSAARGEPAPRDLDIGVWSRGPVDLLDATNRFVEALGVGAVDVVDLRRANPVLLMCVARDGVALYEAHRSAFNEFVSLAMRRYADTKKFRDAVREQLQEYAARQPA